MSATKDGSFMSIDNENAGVELVRGRLAKGGWLMGNFVHSQKKGASITSRGP
jgi:hypothetical protein